MATSIGFDIYAKDRASRAFHEIGRSADGTTGKLRVLGKVGKFAALGLAAGVVGLAYAGGKLAKSAIEDQQSAALMAKQFHKSAHATDEQVKATERWITKQGIAKGVADDDLRPALASLVTATHSVGKAQRLASLAMDISAAKGKSLSSVSTALMKAQNGNVGGLGRLGVATKDAAGKTLTFAQIQKNLSKEFGGAATTKANTLAGKMERLKLIMREAGESIGYKLIPVLTSMATWILNKGIPALDKFGKWFNAKIMPAISAVSDFIRGKVIPTFAHMGDQGSKTAGLMKQFAGSVSQVWANVKSIFVSVGSILSSFWKKYGDLITQYGIGTLKNLLNVVRGVFNIIAGLFKVIAAVMHGDWKGAWQGIQQITRGAVQVVKGLVGQMFNLLRTVFSAGWRTLKTIVGAAWDGIKGVVAAGGRSVVNGVKAIPGKIAALAGSFRAVGKSLINAFIDGIAHAAGFVGKIAGTIWGALKGLINNAIDKINGALNFGINKGPVHINVHAGNIPHLATGGVVKARRGGTLALLGEGGSDEAVIPLSGRHAPSMGAAGGSRDLGTFTFEFTQDGKKIHTALLKLKREQGGYALGLA